MNLFEKHFKEKEKDSKKGSKEEPSPFDGSDMQTEGSSQINEFEGNSLVEKLGKDTDVSFFKSTNPKNTDDDSLEVIDRALEIIDEKLKGDDFFEVSNAQELYEEYNAQQKVPFGVPEIDKILDGGLEPKSLTEVYGIASAGKTQLCFQLVAHTLVQMAQMQKQKKIIFVDTENTFKPNRLLDILKGYGIDNSALLKEVMVFRVFTVKAQMDVLEAIEQVLRGDSIGLLVIDSLTALFRSEYHSKTQLIERQQILGLYLSKLNLLAYKYNFPIFTTNQISANPDEINEPVKHVGGNIVAHTITHRLHLSKIRPNISRLTLVDSPNLPSATCKIEITSQGLE